MQSACEPAKFLMVQLGKQQEKIVYCFCLTHDFNELCRSLYTLRKDIKKISDVIFRPRTAYIGRRSVKLREAAERQSRHQAMISREAETVEHVYISV